MSTSVSRPEDRARSRPGAATARRVLLVARWPVGGIRTHLAANQPALTAGGHLCSLVVPEGDFVAPLKKALPSVELITAPAGVGLWRVVRDELATGRYDLVHAHGLGAAAHAAFACLRQEAPLIITLHEPLRHAQFAGLAGPGRRWLLGRALARARAIITVSDDARANLLRHFPNLRRILDRVQTVPNGIDAGRFDGASDTGALRRELGLSAETALIGFLGRFMPEKGFPLLIEAARRLAHFGGVPGFHIVAFGSSDYRGEYQALVEREGLSELITLKDAVPDVAPVLGQLDLVVVPSLWEASSLVSMEAMAAGAPVLGSDCPGLREVLRDTPSRTFTAGDLAALETALRSALARPWCDEARRYAAEARRRFDNQASASRLVEIYHRCTAEADPLAA